MISLKALSENRKKVLGRNERQLIYIRKYNKSRAIKIADNKVIAKQILARNNIPVPEKIAVIRSNEDLDKFDFDSLPKSFVVKPVRGVRGSGVEIFYNRDKDGNWIRSDGSKVNLTEMKILARDIIDGKYSLFNQPDIILIEERVKPHKNFKYYTFKGTPDVRVIVYNSIPIMAYIRFPTRESKGKANLDLGAIAAGIDIAVGKTTTAISGKATKIEHMPDTNLPTSGLKIPYWDKILRYAIEASNSTKLGFAAVDFLIDRDKGPLIVELNARPGLSIQLANEDGLRWRLKKAYGIKVKSVEQGMRIGKDLFGGEIEEEIEEISGKKLIGLTGNAKLYSVDERRNEEVKVKIDTGADSTSMDRELAIRLGFGDIIAEIDSRQIPEDLNREQGLELMKSLAEELMPKFEYLNDIDFIKSSHGNSIRPSVNIAIEIDGLKFQTKANIYDRSQLDYKVIIGRKSLSNFLIDPTKKS
jgi:alpha-L-glutamate ligase-like protein